MKFPAAIIEIPHQGRPAVYIFLDQDDLNGYIDSVEETANKGDGIEYTPDTRESKVLEWAAHDLNALRILNGEDEIRAYPERLKKEKGHQWVEQTTEINNAIEQWLD